MHLVMQGHVCMSSKALRTCVDVKAFTSTHVRPSQCQVRVTLFRFTICGSVFALAMVCSLVPILAAAGKQSTSREYTTRCLYRAVYMHKQSNPLLDSHCPESWLECLQCNFSVLICVGGGWLANVPAGEFTQLCEGNLPAVMSGTDFQQQYGEHFDSATQVMHA